MSGPTARCACATPSCVHRREGGGRRAPHVRGRRRALRDARPARPRGARRRRPTGAGTATGSSSPPTSTSIRPTSASCGTPACSAPSRGCRRRRAPTPGRWRRCSHEAEQARGMPTREFHIVGGLHPKLRLSYYTDMIRGLKERHPQVHIKALTAVEIAHLARIEKISRARGAARACGRPGSPACPAAARRCSARRCGPRSPSGSSPARSGSACIASRTSSAFRPTAPCSTATSRRRRTASRISRMLRDLQDETGGFLTYIPLAYHPDHNELGEELGRVGHRHDRLRGPQEHRRRPAVPRQHPARQDALAHGDAVPVADRARISAATTWRARWCTSGSITKPARTPTCTCPTTSWCELIRGAGKRPVERDSLYQPVREQFDDPAARARPAPRRALPVVHAA